MILLIKYWREIVIAAFLCLAGFVVHEWLGSRDAMAKAQATIGAQAQVIAQEKQQYGALTAGEQKRDAATAQQIAAMQAQVARLKTAEQIVAWLPKQVALPEPVKIELPPALPARLGGPAGTKANPAPSAVATIPPADLPALRDYVESCKECQARLGTAEQDLAAKDQQLKLAGEQLSATEQQRDAAVKAMKGGGFWSRLKRGAKWFLIGAAAGAVAAKEVH